MNRTDENQTIAVVRTRLPYTDRRSLSQAWFSALHVSEGPRAQPAASNRAPAHALASAAGRPPNGRRTAGATREAASMLRRTRDAFAPAPRGGFESSPARATRHAATVAPRPRPSGHPPLRTSLTVGVAGERVALVLRRDGATLHVVAVCRPAVERAVREALARAAAHVRGSGDALRASVRVVEREQP